ncbi:MAG: WS/DGAT/MGAT family O-acyltransferase [Gammaproteobacteria bacterium]
MLQLSGLDTAFLNMETSATFGHVATLMVLDAAGFRGEPPYEAVRAHMAARVPQLPPLHRKLVTVPFDLDRPYWINDGEVDLEFHLRHLGVPPPGDDEQLNELIASIVARPIDRTRPLWELYVIEGHVSGDVSLLLKQHHASIDGASSMEMFRQMFDLDPAAVAQEPPPSVAGDRAPGQWELLARTNLSLLRHPGRAISLQFRAASALAQFITGGASQSASAAIEKGWSRWLSSDNPFDSMTATGVVAPRTPLNASITSHRRYATLQVELDRIKALKNAAGTTLNDVVMAICSGALRRYLLRHDALPREPLIAMVPVSVRTGDEVETYSNKVSAILAELATDEVDPVKRLRRINQAMQDAKELHHAVPASLLQDFAKFATPAVAAQAARTVARWQLADRLAPMCNVVISNVPGPREKLYIAGAELKALLPVSTISEGMALNMTLISYRDLLNFGYVACRERVPDLPALIEDTRMAIDELAEALGIPVAGQR